MQTIRSKRDPVQLYYFTQVWMLALQLKINVPFHTSANTVWNYDGRVSQSLNKQNIFFSQF